MAEAKRLLVLTVDIDDDLGEKAKIKGPVIGRERCLQAASKLAVADPTDVDANTLFEAVKTFDELNKENKVEIAALTGSSSLGYKADREIVKQLEKVLGDFHPEACVFVSDGASDEQILPLVQSRIKVNSVKTVTVKQTKELEKTYFVLLEKLKEPAFARVVYGIPGLALILYFLWGGLGIRVFVGLLGAYLILKGLGFEETFFKRISRMEFSTENISFIFYFAAVPLIIVALWLAISKVSYLAQVGAEENIAKLGAWFVKDLLLLLPVALLIIIVGMVVEAIHENRNYLLPKHLTSASAVVLLWLIFNNASNWVLGNLGFAEFFFSLILAVIIMVLMIFLAREFKIDLISKMSLEGKEVYTEIGGFLGKIVSINKRKESFLVQNPRGQKFDLTFGHIANVGEKVIIKY
jgi:putative membrane protein